MPHTGTLSTQIEGHLPLSIKLGARDGVGFQDAVKEVVLTYHQKGLPAQLVSPKVAEGVKGFLLLSKENYEALTVGISSGKTVEIPATFYRKTVSDWALIREAHKPESNRPTPHKGTVTYTPTLVP